MDKVDISKQIMQPESKGSNSSKLILTVGLTLVTAALVLLAAIGGVYVTQLQNSCKPQSLKPEYKENHQVKNSLGEDEDISVDRKHYIERIETKDKNGEVTSVVVLNYQMRIIIQYDTAMRKCYMIAGLHDRLSSFDRTVEQSIRPVDHMGDPTNAKYAVLDKKPVYDTRMITEDLREDCSKGNLYWLERIPSASFHDRKKREWCTRKCSWWRCRIVCGGSGGGGGGIGTWK